MRVTLNENCGEMVGMEGEIAQFLYPHFFYVKLPWLAYWLKLTPGHFEEEEAICREYGLAPVVL